MAGGGCMKHYSRQDARKAARAARTAFIAACPKRLPAGALHRMMYDLDDALIDIVSAFHDKRNPWRWASAYPSGEVTET